MDRELTLAECEYYGLQKLFESMYTLHREGLNSGSVDLKKTLPPTPNLMDTVRASPPDLTTQASPSAITTRFTPVQVPRTFHTRGNRRERPFTMYETQSSSLAEPRHPQPDQTNLEPGEASKPFQDDRSSF